MSECPGVCVHLVSLPPLEVFRRQNTIFPLKLSSTASLSYMVEWILTSNSLDGMNDLRLTLPESSLLLTDMLFTLLVFPL